MYIGIIGLGFVGTAIYNCFKDKNLNIAIYDKYKNGGIGSFKDILKCDILYLCLPTLYCEKNGYNTIELQYILKKLDIENFNGIILIKSTVLPGFCMEQNKKYEKLKIIHNPEFLTARTADIDFKNQKHIILGVTESSSNKESKKIVELFHNEYFTPCELTICSSDESETIKICANSFYSVKIQFFTGDVSSKIPSFFTTKS